MIEIVEKRVDSITSLLDAVTELRALNEGWLFRGQADAAWDLQTRVHREHSDDEERYLTHEFRARAGVRHAYRPRYKDYPDWLALMQHYGLPTRLLDWSRSPLTAAFFATQRTMRHYTPVLDKPTPAAIWALAPLSLNASQGLKRLLYPLNASELRRLVREAFYPKEFDARILAAMAVETDARMQVQRGAFTIHGDPTPLNHHEAYAPWLRKFVILADDVGPLGAAVNALGVGLSDLFPDLGSLALDLASCHRRKARGAK